MKKCTKLLLLLPVLTLLSSCGGDKNPPPAPQPKSATVALATAETGSIPAGTIILAYDVTVTLPPGVTVKSTVSQPQTDEGVVTPSSVAAGSVITSVYTPASGTASGKVTISIISGTGMVAGPICTIQCDIEKGNPKADDFLVGQFSASGLDIANSTVNLETNLRVEKSVSIK